MHPVVRIFLIFGVFATTCIAWMVLGGTMMERTSDTRGALHGQVAELWGSEQTQQAPALSFHWTTRERQIRTETVDGETREIREWVDVHLQERVSPDSTQATVTVLSVGTLFMLMQLTGRLDWYQVLGRDGGSPPAEPAPA